MSYTTEVFNRTHLRCLHSCTSEVLIYIVQLRRSIVHVRSVYIHAQSEVPFYAIRN